MIKPIVHIVVTRTTLITGSSYAYFPALDVVRMHPYQPTEAETAVEKLFSDRGIPARTDIGIGRDPAVAGKIQAAIDELRQSYRLRVGGKNLHMVGLQAEWC